MVACKFCGDPEIRNEDLKRPCCLATYLRNMYSLDQFLELKRCVKELTGEK